MLKIHKVGTPMFYNLCLEVEFGLYGRNKWPFVPSIFRSESSSRTASCESASKSESLSKKVKKWLDLAWFTRWLAIMFETIIGNGS